MISCMNHITLAVKDIDRSFEFYHKVLGLKALVKWDKGAYFLIGNEDNGFWFCLNVDENHVPNPGYTHYAFSIHPEDFKLLSEKIIKSGAKIFKENSSPGDSLYFLDPEGHKLELHVGNWRSRLEAKKLNEGNWKDIEWFI